MSKEHQEPTKTTEPQPPVININNKIVNNAAPHGEGPRKPKGTIAIIIALAGVIIALLTLLFGEGILIKTKNEPEPPAPPISSEEAAPAAPSSTAASAAGSKLQSQPAAAPRDGQTIVTSGQTVKVFTTGEKSIKINYAAKTDTVADYGIIGRRGGQEGEIFRNQTMNPRGGYFPITKWDYFYMTVIEGEVSLDAGDTAVITFEDVPLVVSRTVSAGEAYEATVLGEGTATLTLKGLEEDTKGQYQVYPRSSAAPDPVSFKLFTTDRTSNMLYPGDKIVITVTSGAVEIYGDFTHFQLQ